MLCTFEELFEVVTCVDSVNGDFSDPLLPTFFLGFMLCILKNTDPLPPALRTVPGASEHRA